MEKLDRKDLRFILSCFAVIAAGALTTAALFRRAFPEASIEFRVNRAEARVLAEKFLKEQGRDIASHHFAGRFEVEEEPKVYLERELGLERAGRLYGREAKIWLWEMRWFRSGVKEEERVALSPLGDLVSYESVLREDAPGPSPTEEAARAVAASFLAARGLDPDRLRPIEATPESRPKRTDWRFVDEKVGLRMGEATVRFRTAVAGGRVTAFREFVHVPEAWERDYRKLRAKNEAAGLAATFGLFVTFLAMLAVLVSKIVRKDVRWGLVGAFAGVAFLLALLSTLNAIPLTLYEYDTASPLSSHLAEKFVLGFLGALATGAGIALVVAAAEPIYRERFPAQLSLRGLFSRRGLRSKGVFRGILLGYALTASFFAYQAVFYVVAARFGAWAPAQIPYDNMLNTAFPWATVLLIGFLPAVSEEGISRMFSISFLDRIGAGRFWAVLLPAFIWGFGHAAYPNQPFYIRGIEVGLAGVLIGALMLRYGVLALLVWHFTVDAFYTALLMLRSGNTYYVVSGAISSGILLLPLATSFLLYWRRGGFASEEGLTNAYEGFVPAPPRLAPPPEEVPPVRSVPAKNFALAGALAILLVAGFLLPTHSSGPLAKDSTGRQDAEGLARGFLRANGVSPSRYQMVSYGGTGFADDEQVREVKPHENGRLPGFSGGAARYVLKEGGLAAFEALAEAKLPLTFWVVRFFEPQKKEEWKTLVDARRARVVGFLNPTEEAADELGPPPATERARARALAAAGQLGYPAADYTVVEVGTQARPKRTDTTVVLESSSAGVAEARPRLTAVFHGARLAAFYPSIHVPESFLRDYRRSAAGEKVLLGAKIIAVGAFIGVGVVLFIRIVRRPDFRSKTLIGPLAAGSVLAAAALANTFRSVFRQYPTAISLDLFRFSAVVSLVIVGLVILCAAAVGFVLFSAARPGWRRAMRRGGTLSDAFLRAAIGAAGLAGMTRWGQVLSDRFPLYFLRDPSLPAALDRAIPALAALWSTATSLFLFAAIMSVAGLAAPTPFFRRPPVRLFVLLGLFLALAPTSLHSAGDFAADFFPALLKTAWLALSAFLLLRDHVAAWVLFGAMAYGGPAVASLLVHPAPADRAAGWGALVLIVLGAVTLLTGRRRGAESAEVLSPPGGAR